MYGAGSCAVRRGSGPSRPFGEELLGLRSGLRKAIALPMIMRTHDQSSVEGHIGLSGIGIEYTAVLELGAQPVKHN